MYNEIEVYRIANERLIKKYASTKEELEHKNKVILEIKNLVDSQSIEDSFKTLVLKRLFKQEAEYDNAKSMQVL